MPREDHNIEGNLLQCNGTCLVLYIERKSEGRLAVSICRDKAASNFIPEGAAGYPRQPVVIVQNKCNINTSRK